MALTVNTVIALDSIVGKSLIFASMIGVSFGVWKLSFEREYLFTGLFAFFVFAGYFAWIAIKLRFVDPFTPMIRM